jgi:hypothetical protein
MTVKPPLCKTCGKAEWGHICSGLPAAKARIHELEQRAKPKSPHPKLGNAPAGGRRIKKGRH